VNPPVIGVGEGVGAGVGVGVAPAAGGKAPCAAKLAGVEPPPQEISVKVARIKAV